MKSERRSGKISWREAATEIWTKQWEAILGLAGFAVALARGEGTWWMRLLYGGLGAALLWSILREVRKTLLLLREKHIPLVAVVKREGGELKTTLAAVLDVMGEAFDPQRYQAFNVQREDWVVHHEVRLGHEREAWLVLCRRFAQRAHRLEALPGKTVLHIFLNCPATLALGLGASLGTHHQLRVYHWCPGYRPVLRFDAAEAETLSALLQLKTHSTAAFETIAVSEPPQWTEEVFVGLHLARHAPHRDFRALAAARRAAYVAIDNLYHDRLAEDADWFPVARETAQALYTLLDRAEVRQLHLGLSCPLPLAFAIGMALGIHSPISVYNWFTHEQTYTHVLDLHQI